MSGMFDTITSAASNSWNSVTSGFAEGGLMGGLQAIVGIFKPNKPEQTGFSLDEFRESFSQGEKHSMTIARTNLFEAMIKVPRLMSAGYHPIAKSMIYRIQGIELPSRTIATTDVSTYGPKRKIAYGTPSFQTVEVTIISNEAMDERNFLMHWLDIIQIGRTDKTPFDGDVAYYDSYTGEIEVRVYDADGGKPRLVVRYFEAYPIEVKAVPLSWADTSTYMTHVVTFAFHSFHEVYNEKAKEEDTSFLGQLKNFRNNIRNMVTDIKNMRTTFKQTAQSLRDMKKQISEGNKLSGLDRLEALAAAPDMIAGGLGDAAFKLLDRSNSSSATGVFSKVGNYASSFFD